MEARLAKLVVNLRSLKADPFRRSANLQLAGQYEGRNYLFFGQVQTRETLDRDGMREEMAALLRDIADSLSPSTNPSVTALIGESTPAARASRNALLG